MTIVVILAIVCFLTAAILSARDKAYAFALTAAGLLLLTISLHPHLHL
jgi:hypothetical protein